MQIVNTKKKAFTLLEILLVITLIGILIGITLVSINPNRQLGEARNLNRRSHINDLYEALETYSIRNSGTIFNGITSNYKEICDTSSLKITDLLPSTNYCDGKLDLRELVPNNINSIPKDNQATGTGSTGYEVAKDNKNQISIRAKNAELGQSIAINGPSDILYAKAGAFPSLDLDFASNKSLIDNVSGKNLIDFTRNSIGTYVGADGLIKTAGINEPRFDHDPVTGESLGLLVEEVRTNLELNSATLGAWTSHELNKSTNNGTSPDGALTSSKFVITTTNDAHYLSLSFNSFGGNPYDPVFSVFIKPIEQRKLAFIHSRGNRGQFRASIDFDTGTIELGRSGNAPGDPVVSYKPYANGWYRVSFATDVTAWDSHTFYICAYDTLPSGFVGYSATALSMSSFAFAGDGVASFYAWGIQREESGYFGSSFPTSYIPTSGSTVTRSADVMSITGTNFSNFFNTLEGTFFTDYRSTSPTNARILNFGTGATSTIISNEGVIGSGSNFSSIGNIAGAASNGVKVAATTSISESAGAFNGNIAVSTGATSYYTGATSLNLLPDIAGATIKQNWLKRITYWPTRLPNSTLQTITQ